MLNIGNYNKLKVVRTTDIGYILVSEDNEEVFLHKKEVIEDLNIDSFVNCFLYLDKQKRITGTMHKALVTTEVPGFARVVSKNEEYGLFVNIGIQKDILLSKDYLPKSNKLWPEEEDQLLVILKNKSKGLEAKPLDKYEIEQIKSDKSYELKSKVEAIVHRISEQGTSLITEAKVPVWVHVKNQRSNYRMGEKVEVTITHINDLGQYSGMLVKQKEDMISLDANQILKVLNDEYQGKMPFTSDTNADLIQEKFMMSKKAFKRALGNLYKNRVVDFIGNDTILVEEN
ncbi:MAG: S1-like domain-containing RNA-binding protein [Erysipelotrichales bacterium]|nr:S1-like domain-containing RNA-binding protein [Erysipelotrichales bacterium]